MDTTHAPRLHDESRRRILIGLVATVPAAYLLQASAALAAEDAGSGFLEVSRVITGNDALSGGIAERIHGLLSDRIDGFVTKVADLLGAMGDSGRARRARLLGLDDDQVAFALEIAKPWYLGYVGSPSTTILKDDAVFATYLNAQSYERIIDEVPRPTYPGRGAGWWGAPPPDVVAPDMPDGIAGWTTHPEGPATIMTPDPIWKAYATAKHESIAEARMAKPVATPTPASR